MKYVDMKIFKELSKTKGEKIAVAQLEAVGSPLATWKVTLTLLLDGRRIASEEKITLWNEWTIRLEHSGFVVYAQRKVLDAWEPPEIYLSLE